MNIVIAIFILSAIFLLKDSASHYQPRSAFDSAYISVAERETDTEVLKHGIVHTEAARAHAYRSILRQSQGTFIVGLLVAVAFLGNSIFIYRMMKNQNTMHGSRARAT
ncbi:MAG: hypothetical protein KJO79_02285 [Verrucomicrobiae bacterium]|nr:hypothetical protein [Verrucomicrobiae bacterium]NNJ85982.1 hypothetical protein [Akkermansiaceae bacterium]